MSLPPIREPRARKDDPLTSHEAAGSISGDAHKDSRDVVLRILAAGPATQPEAVDQAELLWARGLIRYHHSPSRLRSAFTELERAGKVYRTGEKRKAEGARTKAEVWALAAPAPVLPAGLVPADDALFALAGAA